MNYGNLLLEVFYVCVLMVIAGRVLISLFGGDDLVDERKDNDCPVANCSICGEGQ